MKFLFPFRRSLPAAGVASLWLAGSLVAASYYPLRLEDARATYLKPAAGDSTAVLQNAIDHVQETTGQGIVFVEQGRYRISRTIYIWPGIRLIGYGSERPIFALPPNTPGFQSVPSYMIFFAGGRPRAPRMRGFMFQPPAPEDQPSLSPPGKIPDANPGTFYSAVSNINFEIGGGNPGSGERN